MKLLASLRSVLSSLLLRKRLESDTEEELCTHVQNRADDLQRSGLTRTEAERRARIEFGAHEKFKEECRDALGTRIVEVLLQDLRFGGRMLWKSPGFTAVAVLTLAFGIGANTAIFSLLDALVLRDVAVPHPEQLVRFGIHAPDESYLHLSLPMFKEFSQQQKVFSATFGWWGDAVLNVEMNGASSQADVIAVTGNYYSELGATPAVGRLITPEDANLESMVPTEVAVLDYGFWQRHYGGAKDVIGKTIKIEDVPFTILGVTRKGFNGLSVASPEVIVPLTAKPLILPGEEIWLGTMG